MCNRETNIVVPPPYPEGTRSKTQSGCLKLYIEPKPIYTMFFSNTRTPMITFKL